MNARRADVAAGCPGEGEASRVIEVGIGSWAWIASLLSILVGTAIWARSREFSGSRLGVSAR